MPRTVDEVMTRDPIIVSSSATLTGAAAAMREADVGDVIVMRDGKIIGILTDRDIVIRAVAEGSHPGTTTCREITSANVCTLAASDPISDAVALMRKMAVRRVPVVRDGRPVGIVTLGDLAMALDEKSALAQISAAPPND